MRPDPAKLTNIEAQVTSIVGALIDSYVGEYGPEVASCGSFWVQSPPSIRDEVEGYVNEIVATLGPRSRFRGRRELEDCIIEALSMDSFEVLAEDAAVSDNPGAEFRRLIEEYKSGLVKALTEPLPSYAFMCSVASGSSQKLIFEIGGANNLKFFSAHSGESEDSAPCLCLQGTIEAGSAKSAVFGGERVVRQTIGAFLAVGIAELVTRWSDSLFERQAEVKLTVQSKDAPRVAQALAPDVVELVRRLRLCSPDNLDDLESRKVATGQSSAFLSSRLHPVLRLLAGSSERCMEVKNASVHYARACVSPDPGESVAYSLFCVEALLLEKRDPANVVSRLQEAVAYRLGRTAEERRKLRQQIRDLYGIRSEFVHTGATRVDAGDEDRARQVAAQVLRLEITDLP